MGARSLAVNQMKSFTTFMEKRFLLCVGCGAVTSFLLWFGKLDSGSYTAIIMATVGAYVAGGVVERTKEIKAQGPTP